MLPVPTYLTNPRHLGFDSGLYDSAAEYRGWGELGVHHPVSHPGPGGPSLPVTSWAGTPTSPPLAHSGGVEDRSQEDSVSNVIRYHCHPTPHTHTHTLSHPHTKALSMRSRAGQD